MKIVIEVGDGEIAMVGPTVDAVLSKLTPEQYEKIAAQAIDRWLTTTLGANAERAAHSSNVLEALRVENQKYNDDNKYSSYRSTKPVDDKGILGSSEHAARMRSFQSSHERIVAMVSQALVNTARATGTKVVVESIGSDIRFDTREEASA